MTPDELKKEAERLHEWFHHTEICKLENCGIYLKYVVVLRAVHDAGFTEARVKAKAIADATRKAASSDNHGWIMASDCISETIDALKIGDGEPIKKSLSGKPIEIGDGK